MIPNTTITTDKTVASTGLFILTEDKLIEYFSEELLQFLKAL